MCAKETRLRAEEGDNILSKLILLTADVRDSPGRRGRHLFMLLNITLYPFETHLRHRQYWHDL